MLLRSKKVNILLDGQFGSTGKGSIAGKIACDEHVDIFICNNSPNAGHTFIKDNKIYIVKQLPVGSVLNDRSTIFLCAGSVINPILLLEEIEKFNIDPNRLIIHPRAAIIRQSDIDWESKDVSSTTKIASTQSGTGSARAGKILRSGILAGDTPELKYFIKPFDIVEYLDFGCTVFMETSQGIGLGLDSGYKYPYCTSKEISVSSSLSDIQVHPKYLGSVILSLRTYPIRVGNIVKDGQTLGRSGDFYPDSKEISWEDLGVEKELTTVTKRVRRVSTFSKLQLDYVYKLTCPDFIFLNFINYLKSETDLKDFYNYFAGKRCQYFSGKGPDYSDIEYHKNLSDMKDYLNLYIGERIREQCNLTSRI